MPYQTGIPAALAAEGVKVELVPGWETRGSSTFNPACVVCHWTAGPRTGDRPSLRVIIEGLPGLAGPLCQVFLARSGVAVVVAAGRANHAGVGGWNGAVGNSAAFGIEAESAGDGDWTAAQLHAYPHVVAALCRVAGVNAAMVCGHNEWATPRGRKVDIRDWPMDRMRAQVDALLARQPTDQGDDMTPEQAKQLAEVHDALMPGRANERNEGYVRQQARLAREASEAAAAAVQSGQQGVRQAGLVVRLLASLQTQVAAAGKAAATIDADALAEALVAAGIGDVVVDAIHKRTQQKP